MGLTNHPDFLTLQSRLETLEAEIVAKDAVILQLEKKQHKWNLALESRVSSLIEHENVQAQIQHKIDEAIKDTDFSIDLRMEFHKIMEHEDMINLVEARVPMCK